MRSRTLASLVWLGSVSVTQGNDLDEPSSPPTPPVAHEPSRDRFIVGGSAGMGIGLLGEVHAGWMIDRHVAALASVSYGLPFTDEGHGFTAGLAGLRLWPIDRAYLDLRAGIANASHGECMPSGTSCTTTGLGWHVSLGGELVHTPGFALDLHVALTAGDGEGVLTGALGVDFF